MINVVTCAVMGAAAVAYFRTKINPRVLDNAGLASVAANGVAWAYAGESWMALFTAVMFVVCAALVWARYSLEAFLEKRGRGRS
ncbi:hypothetical protein ACWF2L_03150 [Streptomyces anulatus]